MPAKRVTYREYLKWLAIKPRTELWGAYVAYDRDKCNQLLRQEYNEKFDNESFMPPITKPYLSGETTWKWTLNCVTDAPRLSYENNANDDTSAYVNMSMGIIGGTVIELSDAAGPKEVTKISSYDPLDYPKLYADKVLLKDVKGQVDQGAIVLDLGSVESQKFPWELDDSRILHQRRLGGAFLKRMFREAKPENRTFSLGKLAYTEQDFLKPSLFKIRTVLEEGAQVRNAPNFGNGVVEIGIAMKGELEGGWAGGDWLYPIPSDLPGIDSCLILDNQLVFESILWGSIRRAFNAPDAMFKKEILPSGYISRLRALPSNGFITIPPADAADSGLRFLGFEAPLRHDVEHSYFDLAVYHSGDGVPNHLGFTWGTRNMACGVSLGGETEFRPFKLSMVIAGMFNFKIDADSRKISVVFDELNGALQVDDSGTLPDWVVSYLLKQDSLYYFKLMEHVKSFLREALSFDAIDAFVLNSLLFNSTDAVQLKTVDNKGDLVSFGTISPRLTTFTITDQDKLLGYGASHTFATFPEVPGVKWSVQNLDGSTSGVGKIDQDTGQYTAPDLADISGTYKRVKVIATGAAGGHLSKALVTVVVRSITLNPIVETCGPTTDTFETRQFSASTISGSLKWEVIGDGKIPEEGVEKNIYTAPPQEDMNITKRSFSIDKVKVTNSASPPQTQTSFVVVKHNKQTLVVLRQLEGLGPNQAQFSAKFNGGDAPEPSWGCIPETGAGSIDQNGLFTADPASQYQYVIITVRSELSGYFLGDAYYIQPFPMEEIPGKPSVPETPQALIDGLPEI